MGLWATIVTFLQNDFLPLFATMAGCFLVLSQVKKRSMWPLRIIVSFLAIAAWMILFKADFSHSSPETLLCRSLVKYIGMFLLNAIAAMFYSEANFFMALFAATVGYCIQHTCEKTWNAVNLYVNVPSPWDKIILCVLIITTLYIFGRFAVWNSQYKRFNKIDRVGNRLPILIAAAVMSINILLDMLMFYAVSKSGMPNPVSQHTRIYSAVVAFLVLVISMCLFRESDSQIRAEIADQLLHSEQSRYEKDKAIHDAINIKCHDIRHQIAALGKSGYEKELHDIGKLVDIYDATVHSKNTALDVVLSNKSLTCLNKGITFSCIADGRNLSFMADEDIYALFGNILDNAIEAVSDFSESERRIISLNVRTRAGCIVIEEENFYEGELLFRNGLPVTSKSNKDYHGFGMQSIQTLINKYEGDLELGCDHQIFKLSILLPVPDQDA